MAVQTEFPDVMDNLKDQIMQLTKIVADLTAPRNNQSKRHNRHFSDEEILSMSDSLSDVVPFDPDAEVSSNQPVPETPPEGPQSLNPPGITQSVPLAAANTKAMAPPPPHPPSLQLQSPLSPIDPNVQIVHRTNRSYGPTDDHRHNVESIVSFGSNMITTAMACVDVLLTDDELANGNTSGSNGYQQLDEIKLHFLESTLRRTFESPAFASQWENVRAHINTKCRGKQRTVIRRLQKKTNF